MDSAKILQWLNGQNQPGDQDLKDIRLLNEEFSYWPVAQWLYARYVKKDLGESVAHYKTDPIQFARFFASTSSLTLSENEQLTVSELEVTDSVQDADELELEPQAIPSPQEEPKQEELVELTAIEPTPEITDIEEKQKMPVQSHDSEIGTKKENETLPHTDQRVPTASEERSENAIEIKDSSLAEISAPDDILALIHDLPNSIPASEELQNLMPMVELKAEEMYPEPDVSEEDQEDDKSLMVMMSFTDWLHYFKNKRKQEQEEEDGKRALRTAWQKEKLTAAIEEETDAIPEPIFKQAMESISADSGVISESLALVLAKQGKFDKAIEMYRKLSLRNPQKSTYFASLIQELRLKQNG